MHQINEVVLGTYLRIYFIGVVNIKLWIEGDSPHRLMLKLNSVGACKSMLLQVRLIGITLNDLLAGLDQAFSWCSEGKQT